MAVSAPARNITLLASKHKRVNSMLQRSVGFAGDVSDAALERFWSSVNGWRTMRLYAAGLVAVEAKKVYLFAESAR